MAEANIDASQNGITFIFTVKRYNQWRVRLWLAMLLIKFACWFAWVDVEINDDTKDGELYRMKKTDSMFIHKLEKV